LSSFGVKKREECAVLLLTKDISLTPRVADF
jgi:hypothetical protein